MTLENTVVLDPIEAKRIYTFPNGELVELIGVTELTVRPSGTHRLKTQDGHLHIVPSGWLHVEIDTSAWTI